MFHYNIVEFPNFSINQKTIDIIFKKISNLIKKEQKWVLNIVFLDSNSIQNLNNNYRWINKTTDVLSFHYYDDFSTLKPEDIAWEIVLNEEKIISQWKEFWLWTQKEFYKLIIHSILHILWYDHETDDDYKIMSQLEKTIWQEVFEK
jgi:probable rRNA maturation factor